MYTSAYMCIYIHSYICTYIVYCMHMIRVCFVVGYSYVTAEIAAITHSNFWMDVCEDADVEAYAAQLIVSRE